MQSTNLINLAEGVFNNVNFDLQFHISHDFTFWWTLVRTLDRDRANSQLPNVVFTHLPVIVLQSGLLCSVTICTEVCYYYEEDGAGAWAGAGRYPRLSANGNLLRHSPFTDRGSRSGSGNGKWEMEIRHKGMRHMGFGTWGIQIGPSATC